MVWSNGGAGQCMLKTVPWKNCTVHGWPHKIVRWLFSDKTDLMQTYWTFAHWYTHKVCVSMCKNMCKNLLNSYIGPDDRDHRSVLHLQQDSLFSSDCIFGRNLEIACEIKLKVGCSTSKICSDLVKSLQLWGQTENPWMNKRSMEHFWKIVNLLLECLSPPNREKVGKI